jgi:hypothetical protein
MVLAVKMSAVSWDILIQDLPRDVSSVAAIPDDVRPEPLGSRAGLIAKICEWVPSADFTDPSWGDLVTSDFVIEFNMGDEEICDSIMLHVRGGGSAADFVAGLLGHLGLPAIDCSAGEFFSPSTAAASFQAWQEFRDRALGL